MSKSAREKAREIREHTNQLLAEQTGEAPEAENQPAPDKPESEDEQQQVEGASQGQDPGEQGTLQNEPETPDEQAEQPNVAAEIAELRKQAEQAQRNYDELRSYADRVNAENARLRSDIAVLTTAGDNDRRQPAPQQPAQQQTEQGQNTGEQVQQVEAITEERPGESDQEYMARLAEAIEEYPDVAGPIVAAMDHRMKRMQERMEAMESRLTPAVDNLRTRIESEEADRERQRREAYFGAIAEKHPDYKAIVSQDKFADWLRQHPMGRWYRQLVFPNRQAGERGGMAAEVIQVLDEYTQADPAYQDRLKAEQAARERANAAAADDMGEVPRSPAAPQVNGGEAPYITVAQLDEWAKDPRVWKKHQPEIDAAQATGRIIQE